METDTSEESKSSSTTRNGFIGRKRLLWIIVGISAVALVITAIVVPTTIVLKNKGNVSTTTVPVIIEILTTTEALSTTEKETASIQPIDQCAINSSIIQNYPNNSQLTSVISADINHDNRPDIIISFVLNHLFEDNIFEGWVDILYNNGDNTFTVKTVVNSIIFSPCWLAVADVNSDNEFDIIILKKDSPGIKILFNNGNDTFTEQRSLFNGYQSRFMTTADLNNDNKPDIIVSYYDSMDISILFNTDNGTFTEQMNYNTDCQMSFITAADLNNNDSLDIIVTCISYQKVLILFNDGNGNFPINKSVSTGFSPTSVAAVDINNDHKRDLIVTNDGSNNVGIYLNIENGEFADPTIYPIVERTTSLVIGRATSVAVENVNSDKNVDFVVNNPESIHIFFNTGNGTFPAEDTYFISLKMKLVAINDMNGDNQLDIIVGNEQSVGIVFMYCG